VKTLVELAVVIAGVLSGITVVSAMGYFILLRKAEKEYRKARSFVDDVILSFNKELRGEAKKLEVLAYKVEGTNSRASEAASKVRELEGKVTKLQEEAVANSEEERLLSARLTDLVVKTGEIGTSQERLSSKISMLDEEIRRPRVVADDDLEGVIPIKKEKALAQLTQTEMLALEMLASEGAKTSPEIKERLKLSREHTARLMKKLYEEGYLERETGKIPFRYSVKKEMAELLRKSETGTA
jgi:DNA-binding CsgD family transcriptional regulator